MKTLPDKELAAPWKFTIKGEPVSLARGRWAKGHVYDSQKNLKLLTAIYLQQQFPHDEPLLTGPLQVDFMFYFKRPQKTRGKEIYYTAVPDLDNCIKWICDVGNSILWSDDKLIVKITAEKRYDAIERTEFTVTSLRNT